MTGRSSIPDYEVFKHFYGAFDRPAFKGPSGLHSDTPAFEKAMNDTILTLNTGVRRTRSGVEIDRGPTKNDIVNKEWRQKIKNVENSLSEIKRILKSEAPYYIQTKGELVDKLRDNVIRTINPIFQSLGLDQLPVPTEVKNSNDVWRRNKDWIEE